MDVRYVVRRTMWGWVVIDAETGSVISSFGVGDTARAAAHADADARNREA